MDTETIYNIIGTIGAILILLGFYRTSIGQWESKSFIYELDNLVGASFLVVYQLHHQAVISVVVNVIWALVAFRGLTSVTQRYNLRSIAKKRRRKT